VASRADQVGTGAAQVATGADQVATGVDQVATGAAEVATGAAQVATGAAQVATGADSIREISAFPPYFPLLSAPVACLMIQSPIITLTTNFTRGKNPV